VFARGEKGEENSNAHTKCRRSRGWWCLAKRPKDSPEATRQCTALHPSWCRCGAARGALTHQTTPNTLAPRPDPGLRRSPLASRFAGRPRDSRLGRGSKWRPHSGSLPRARSSGSGLQRPHRRLACAGKSERSPNLAGFRNLLPVAVVPSLLDFFQRPRRDGRPEILSLWPRH